MPNLGLNKNALDVSQVFQTYIAFCGDVDKTAVALDLDRETIRDLARVENWQAKVEQWNNLREGDPRDVQIQINRAVNYVQAHRAREVLDKIIQHLSTSNAEELVAKLTVGTKYGSELKTRALTDLIKAMEACQLMTARALGDTAAERPEASENSKGSNIALLVMEAMNAADANGLNSVEVVRQQLKAPPKS